MQHDGPVSERLGGGDGGLDVAAHREKIVGVDVLVMLARVDRQSRIAPRRQAAGDHPQRQRSEIAAAAMHLQEEGGVGGRPVLGLPECRRDREPVDRLDRQKGQPRPRQRAHVVRKPDGGRGGFVLDARRDLRHGQRTPSAFWRLGPLALAAGLRRPSRRWACSSRRIHGMRLTCIPCPRPDAGGGCPWGLNTRVRWRGTAASDKPAAPDLPSECGANSSWALAAGTGGVFAAHRLPVALSAPLQPSAMFDCLQHLRKFQRDGVWEAIWADSGYNA